MSCYISSAVPCSTKVPNVVGYTRKKAIDELRGKYLNYLENDVYSKRDALTVLKQAPKGSDKEVAPGTLVTIAVAVKRKLPSVKGLSPDLAKKMLKGEDYRLKVRKDIEKAYSDEIGAGDVIATNPRAGSEISPGDEVELVVSRGLMPTMPDLRGKKPGNAATKLKGTPWHVKTVETETGRYSDYAKGTVEHTDPAVGKGVPYQSKVTLFLSKGKPDLKDVRGWKPADARTELEGAPWYVNVLPYKAGGNSSYCPGTIERTSPPQGKPVSRNQDVTFYLSKGKKNGKNSGCLRHNLTNALQPRTPSFPSAPSIHPKLSTSSQSAIQAPTRGMSPAKRRALASTFLDSSGDKNTCGNWFGPLVVALACDDDVLGNAGAKEFSVGGTFDMDVHAQGAVVSTGPGYAQALGTQLVPGDSVSLFGTAPAGTRFGVRLATTNGGMAEALFDDVGLSDGGRVDLVIKKDGSDSSKDGVPDAELRVAGKIERPGLVLVHPSPPCLLALKDMNKGIRIAFKATASKTEIRIIGKTTQLGDFSIKTRGGRLARISVPLAGRARSVTLISSGKNGIPSSSATGTRAPKPYVRRLHRTRGGLEVIFVAKASKTRIKLYAGNGKRIAMRTVATRPGARKRVLLRVTRQAGPVSVVLVSCGRYGFNSLPAIRRAR